ncbi:ABC transporter substrate-binding protein [Haloterrigena longa]|uniref:ABC transporter substrate-binding protein n=2 Tax=Natrinema longum TaxID=370324 RepID=A0A8A2UAL3_9EURY|nr:ABC transporter substrate-binding protein [Natrinema longum]MBZ6496441.1 ABC transporter substrate-binding protein [Natrinema longum]QSW85653.1 ABC transporter substrate-binding protein [Natrinema longum]
MKSTEEAMGGISRRGVLTRSGLTLGALSGLAGCLGSGGGTQQFSPIADELTVWHAMGGTNGETLDTIAADFESEHGTSVNMEFQDSYEDVLTNTLAAFDSGSVSDMLQVDSLFAQQVLDTGQVRPVEQILPDDFETDDFLDNVAEFFTVDGELASLPFNNSNAIMYINRDAFEEAGLDPDDPPRTLAEVRSASEQLVDQGVTQYGITWPNHVWFVETWYGFEGQLMTDAENGHAGDPSTFRTPDAIYDLFEWWKGMADDGLYTNPGVEAWGEATSLFIEQEAAMVLTSTASVAGLIADSEDFDVDAAPYPSISDTRVGPVIGGASFYVPDGLPEDRYEEIGQLLEYMAAPEVQTEWHKGSGYYPITQPSVDSLREEGWFEENPMYNVALEQLQNGDADDPATKRALLGPARNVQTTVQDKSVDIINADDIGSEIDAMKDEVETILDDYYN